MSDDARETAKNEVIALMEREEKYGAMKTIWNTGEICKSYYTVVDRFGYHPEVVAVALGYVDRYIQSGNALPKEQFHDVLITTIFIAIKAVHSVSESEAARLVKALGTLFPIHVDMRTVLDMEKEMLATLDWRLNPPTMHQFTASYCEFHPLRRQDKENLEYIRGVTLFQVEEALFHKTLMVKFKPSVIAFAAMLRAEEQLDDTVITFEMRDQFLSLQPILNLDSSVVLDAMFALENAIPKIPTVEEVADERRISAAVRQAEIIGYAPESPTGVGVF